MTVSTIIINSILSLILVLIAGKELISKSNEKTDKKIIIPSLFYTFFITINDYTEDRLIKTIVSFIAIIILYKIIYNKDWFNTIMLSLEIYLLILFSEIILCIICYILFILNLKPILLFFNNSIMINFIVIFISISMLFLFKKRLTKINEIIEKYRNNFTLFYFFILLLMLSILLNKINLTKTFLSMEFYINIIVSLFLFFIIIIQLKQKIKYQNFLEKYKKLANFTESIDNVMEEYRIKNHEYKNQLGIIKSLILPTNKELIDYINTLIEKNEITNSLTINQLNNLNLAALKGLLNFKINELKIAKINANILVDGNMKKIRFSNFNNNDKDDLYSIIGVFRDNVKGRLIQKKKKRVFIDISTNENIIKITIGNSYCNHINLEEMKKYGYTTKGKERGIGLYLMQKIITKNDKFTVDTKLKDNIFIQNLYIKNYDK